MTDRKLGRRLGATSLIAIAAVVAFAAIGGTGLAGGLAKPFKAQYGPGGQYTGKVTICHKGWVTIRVALRAWPAHEAHGDDMDACPASAVRAHRLKVAKLKAAKLEAAKQRAKHAKATTSEKAAAQAEKKAKKHAAKADKKASHAAKKHKTSTSDESSTGDSTAGVETSKTHGPPPGRGNGHGNGHGKKG